MNNIKIRMNDLVLAAEELLVRLNSNLLVERRLYVTVASCDKVKRHLNEVVSHISKYQSYLNTRELITNIVSRTDEILKDLEGDYRALRSIPFKITVVKQLVDNFVNIHQITTRGLLETSVLVEVLEGINAYEKAMLMQELGIAKNESYKEFIKRTNHTSILDSGMDKTTTQGFNAKVLDLEVLNDTRDDIVTILKHRG